jgi:hypothetical protein
LWVHADANAIAVVEPVGGKHGVGFDRWAAVE